MRNFLILAFCIFAGQAAAGLWPELLPTHEPVEVERVEQVEPEPQPQPARRPYRPSGTNWMGP